MLFRLQKKTAFELNLYCDTIFFGNLRDAHHFNYSQVISNIPHVFPNHFSQTSSKSGLLCFVDSKQTAKEKYTTKLHFHLQTSDLDTSPSIATRFRTSCIHLTAPNGAANLTADDFKSSF